MEKMCWGEEKGERVGGGEGVRWENEGGRIREGEREGRR